MTRTTRPITHGRRALAAACGLALLLVPAQAAHARLGDLDPAFDGDGVATPAVGAVGLGGAELEAVTTRADGRIVAVGRAAGAATNLNEPVVVQLTESGAPDTGFGATAAGLTRIPSVPTETQLYDVALDGAGRVLAAGGRAASSTAPDLPVALRFGPTGVPDTSFAGAIELAAGQARAIQPLPDGTTLVAGWRGAPGQEAMFVAKLTATGALDTSGFGGGDGIVDVLGGGARAEAMAVDAAGRILLAGTVTFNTGGGTLLLPVLVRLEANGALDAGFGTVSPVASGGLNAVRVDGAGRIVVGGFAGNAALVARVTDAGALDPAFGAGGVTTGTVQDVAEVAALVLDGVRSVVAGRATSPSAVDQILLGSLDAAGAAEPALGGVPPGWRTFGAGAEALGATLGPAGSVYTAGSLDVSTPAVTRHLGNAAPVAALAAAATAAAGAPVAFDAAGSSDPEGEPLRFAFDLDGDGSHEFDGGQNPFAVRSFPAPGTYTVGVRVTDPRGGSATAARSVAVSAAPQPQPEPQLGRQGVAAPTRGVVLYRLPGTKHFVRLTGLAAIPNGTEIDARKGRVLITVEHDKSGRLDAAYFYAGRFIFNQAKGVRPITTLRLSGGSFTGCKAKRSRARAVLAVASAAPTGKKKRVRRLWGDGRGRFRTRGKYGAATVRGTKWLTEDRCAGTFVRVVRGKVSVEDRVRPKRRNKLIEGGEKILIAAGRKR